MLGGCCKNLGVKTEGAIDFTKYLSYDKCIRNDIVSLKMSFLLEWDGISHILGAHEFYTSNVTIASGLYINNIAIWSGQMPSPISVLETYSSSCFHIG